MALQKQLVSLPMDKGLDTKFDSKQTESGYLRKAQNLVYETVKLLRKRNGYEKLDLYTMTEAQITDAIKVSRYKNELLIMTNQRLYAYSETRQRLIDKGQLSSVQSVATSVIKNATNKSQVDSLTVSDFNIFVWKDSTGSVNYSVQDTLNGSFIISNAEIVSSGERPVLAHIEGTIFVIYGDGADLKYKTFSILDPSTLSSATTLASDRHTTQGLIDADSTDGKIVVAYNANNGGTDVSIFTIDDSLTQSSILQIASSTASHALDIYMDSSSRVVLTYSNNSTIKMAVVPVSLSAIILASTLVETISGVTTCCSIETGVGTYKIYYEVSISGAGLNYIKSSNATVGGAISSTVVFKRSVGLGARAFEHDDVIYVPVVLDSEVQSSYFLLNSSGNLITKFANQIAAGPIDYGVLQPVLATDTSKYLVPLIIHNRIQSDNGTFFSTDGVSSVSLNFDPEFKFSNALMADSLHICAGVLRQYDGSTLTEHGFHVFPEVITRTAPTVITIATTTPGVLGVAEVQKLSYSGTVASGSFKINIGAEVTAAINWNDSNATIKAAIEALTAVTTVTVTGSFAAGHTITFDAPIQNFAQIVISDNTLATVAPAAVTVTPTTITQGVAEVKEVQTISFSSVPTQGEFTLDIDGETAAPVNFTQGAAELKTVLEALASITTVTVTGNFSSGFTVTFDSPVTDIEQATVVQNSLSTVSTPGSMSDGSYAYVAVYRWTDNNGLDHKSTPTLSPLTVELQGGTDTQSVTLTVQTLRVTDKAKVCIDLYRTEANGTVYYKVTDDLSPVLNVTTADTVTITDTLSDAALISKEVLYTTGGILENIAAPACYQIASYNGDRLAVVGEDSNRIFFSKQTSEGRPVEFTDAIYRDIDQVGGPVNTIKSMNDKLIVLTENASYYLSGEGPNNAGLQDSMNKPEVISTDIGCVSPDSAVLTPDSLMFKSRKGIYALNGGLTLEYVGARVEEFNSYNITSAEVVGDVNQIRFTTDNGKALVYNYQLDRWATFENHGALSAVTIGSDYYYLREDNVLYKEDRTSFGDAGSPIKLKIETAWLNLTELQGYQRVYNLHILGNFKSAHKLRVKIAYDYNEAKVQEVLINTSDFIDSTVYGTDAVYGASSPYGGSGTALQMRIDLERQKCQAIKITVEDVQSAIGEGLSISGITLRAGAKEGAAKLPSSQKYGTS